VVSGADSSRNDKSHKSIAVQANPVVRATLFPYLSSRCTALSDEPSFIHPHHPLTLPLPFPSLKSPFCLHQQILAPLAFNAKQSSPSTLIQLQLLTVVFSPFILLFA
jgi:hypothetical protein